MSLKSDIYQVFQDMKDGSKKDDYFCKQLDDIIIGYASDLSFTAIPTPAIGTDTSPTGAFTSTQIDISWKFAGGKIKKALEDCIKKMKPDDEGNMEAGDDDLAQAFAKGLDDDPPEWTVNIQGDTVTTTTPPQTVSSSDEGVVTSVFVSAPVATKLKSTFATMKTMTEEGDDGDDTFATDLAAAVKTYYTSSANQCMGKQHLQGVQFVIKVSE